ncbi:hypothetical protein G3I60_05305 [Streptomyces sp. SID13666]|uniref:hypothetical protein n=1 Tax=Streptomyces sp. SID13666 TaxID=2706054 RepID=UPI0013C1BE35|nr:hypothetical protein [Streptomyces sp. SID13666]NEA53588.1 hypothetical protein [Streptomyces sp. SID13666]
MATRTRTPNTTPEQAHTSAPEAADTPAPDQTNTDSGPQAPDVAPLEPPPAPEPAPPAAPNSYVSPTEVIPDAEHLADVILDDATKQPPADLEAVFRPLTAYGSTLQCTVRLVERTFLGPHANPIERLLLPAGAVVSEQITTRIRERLVAQAARSAAGQ